MPKYHDVEFDMNKCSDVHRHIEKIACQDGTLGLRVDVEVYPNMFSVDVGLYMPSTGMGYLARLREGDQSLQRQVDHLSRATLRSVVSVLMEVFHPRQIMSFTDKSITILGDYEDVRQTLEAQREEAGVS